MRIQLNSSSFGIVATLALMSGSLTGCSSDACSRGASAAQAFANKFATCGTSLTGGFSPCFDQDSCETNLKSCTAADEAVLDATATCENEYAGNNDCSFADYTTYTSCATAATTGADGGTALTPGCYAAFSQNQGFCAVDAGS